MPEPTPIMQCDACQYESPWTDGRSRAAGDEVDEFWCQVCGHENPLNDEGQPYMKRGTDD